MPMVGVSVSIYQIFFKKIYFLVYPFQWYICGLSALDLVTKLGWGSKYSITAFLRLFFPATAPFKHMQNLKAPRV